MKITDEMVNAADSVLSRCRPGIPDETIRMAIAAALAVQTQQGVEAGPTPYTNLVGMDDEDRTPKPDGYDAVRWQKADEVHHAMALVADDIECVKILYDALASALPPHVEGVPAVESEPVAWMREMSMQNPSLSHRVELGRDADLVKMWLHSEHTVSLTPLYAHPPRSLSNEGGETVYRWRGPRGGWIYDDEPPKWDHEILTLTTRKGSAGDGAASGTSGNGGAE